MSYAISRLSAGDTLLVRGGTYLESEVRIAVSGTKVSPPLFESMELLGRERSLARLRDAMSA